MRVALVATSLSLACAAADFPVAPGAPIISTLTCQKVISSDKKTGRITVLLAGK